MNKDLIETEAKFAADKAARKMGLPGPGKRLQATRLAANLSIESVAIALHLTTQMVIDLEEDHYANFAGHTFIRGYLRNYARLLGLSADEIITTFNNLELTEHESDKPKLALKTTYRRRSTSIIKWLIILVILAALGLFAWSIKDYFGLIQSKLGLVRPVHPQAKSQLPPKPPIPLKPQPQAEPKASETTATDNSFSLSIKPEDVLKQAKVTPLVIPQPEQE